MTLKKRLFSSPAAFLRTLEQHESSLRNAKKRKAVSRPTRGVLQRQIDRVEEDYSVDDEADEATHEALDAASLLFREPSPEELSLLKEMKAWAERATSQLDAKTKGLIRWLNEHIRPGGKWSDERVIIFTEYRATQNWLQGVLAAEGLTGSDRLMTMYGGMDSKDRERIKAAFQTDPKQSPVRILLATDAASEGIDLQNHCSRMIHFEIPWNPNRLEQRNGRIDRHGQKAKSVRIHHFVGKGYNDRERGMADTTVGDLEADLEFLMRAVRKVEAIREDLGKVGPVIADQVQEAMLGRRTRLDTKQAETESEPVRKLFKFERDLAKQIKALTDKLHETRRELRLDPENVQKVVEVALELAGQPPLEEPRRSPASGPIPSGSRARCSGSRPSGSLGAVRRGLGPPVHGRGPAVRLRPRLVKGRAGCRPRPPEPPARADEPAAPAGRGLVAGGAEAAEPGDGPRGARLGPATPRRGGPRPARGHRRRQPAVARGDHHGGGPDPGGAVLPVRVAQGDAGRPRRRHGRGAVRGGQAEAAGPLAQRPSRCIRPSKPAPRTGRTASRRCSPSGPTRRSPTSRRS